MRKHVAANDTPSAISIVGEAERRTDPISPRGVESVELISGGRLFMKLETVAPVVAATPHYHPTETAILILAGKVRVDYGSQMQFTAYAEAGNAIYIPAWVPHRPWNESADEPMVALVCRNAAREEIIP